MTKKKYLTWEETRDVLAALAGREAFVNSMQRVVPEQWQASKEAWLRGYDAAKKGTESWT